MIKNIFLLFQQKHPMKRMKQEVDIPCDIIANILEFIKIRTFIKFRLVSRHWNESITPDLYIDCLIKHYGVSGVDGSNYMKYLSWFVCNFKITELNDVRIINDKMIFCDSLSDINFKNDDYYRIRVYGLFGDIIFETISSYQKCVENGITMHDMNSREYTVVEFSKSDEIPRVTIFDSNKPFILKNGDVIINGTHMYRKFDDKHFLRQGNLYDDKFTSIDQIHQYDIIGDKLLYVYEDKFCVLGKAFKQINEIKIRTKMYFVSKNNIFIITENEICVYSIDSFNLIHTIHIDKLSKWSNIDDKRIKIYDPTHILGSDDNIFIGCRDGNIYTYSLKTRKLRSLSKLPGSVEQILQFSYKRLLCKIKSGYESIYFIMDSF